MPKIHTHLHLAILLSEKIEIQNLEQMLLGSAYPDCWKTDERLSKELHYKETFEANCDLTVFLQMEDMDDFTLGYYFHLWVDNYIKQVDLQDITKHDCLICDMEMVFSYLSKLQNREYQGKEKLAMDNIILLEQEPMPLYLVSDEKKLRYHELLARIVTAFCKVT